MHGGPNRWASDRFGQGAERVIFSARARGTGHICQSSEGSIPEVCEPPTPTLVSRPLEGRSASMSMPGQGEDGLIMGGGSDFADQGDEPGQCPAEEAGSEREAKRARVEGAALEQVALCGACGESSAKAPWNKYAGTRSGKAWPRLAGARWDLASDLVRNNERRLDASEPWRVGGS